MARERVPPGRGLPERERMRRIERMKQLLAPLVGNPEFLDLGGLARPEDQEAFLRRLLSLEGLDPRPMIERLQSAGIGLPPAEAVDDAELHANLWEVIRALASLGVFLAGTDHLSDRSLYALLREDILRAPVPEGLLDIPGAGGDPALRLRYYAGDDERACREGDFPEGGMPPRESPPYSRDRRLPAPWCPSGLPEDPW